MILFFFEMQVSIDCISCLSKALISVSSISLPHLNKKNNQKAMKWNEKHIIVRFLIDFASWLRQIVLCTVVPMKHNYAQAKIVIKGSKLTPKMITKTWFPFGTLQGSNKLKQGFVIKISTYMYRLCVCVDLLYER